MTVLTARIDQKLIHGQVTLGWAPFLDIEEIIVADYLALESDLLMDIMALGIQPPVKNASFVSPPKLPALLSERRADIRIMILFRDVHGVGEAMGEGLNIASLNLGNQFYKPSPETLRLADSFFVNYEDLKILINLADQGLKIFFQALPADEPVAFEPGRYRWTR
jgi:mannose/fructose/N-acetylgalactosamine-specific phosphotransferase system component IIB